MARRAAIDIGTNSVKLLVADVEDGGLAVVSDHQKTTGLGEGVGTVGRLDPAALQRTARVVREYADLSAGLDAEETRVAGTAALRNTRESNAKELLDMIRRDTGLAVRILDGDEELVIARIATLRQFAQPEPLVIADIGGGSTEVTVAMGGEIAEELSYDTGARNMTEDLAGLAPSNQKSTAEHEQAVWDRFHSFATSDIWIDIRQSRAEKLIFQGGTAYCAARLAADSPGGSLHGRQVSSLALVVLIERVRNMTEAELRGLLHFDPDRAPVLLSGLAIMDFICGACYADHFRFSEYSLRHGMVLAGDW